MISAVSSTERVVWVMKATLLGVGHLERRRPPRRSRTRTMLSGRLAGRPFDLLVALVADHHDRVAVGGEAARLDVDLGDQRAGGVDRAQAGGRRRCRARRGRRRGPRRRPSRPPAPRSPPRRRSRRAWRAPPPRACCGRSPCGRRPGRRRGRAPARPSARRGRRRRSSRAGRRAGPAWGPRWRREPWLQGSGGDVAGEAAARPRLAGVASLAGWQRKDATSTG